MNAVESPDLVWHYTDASGLLGMVQGRQVWATHFQFMNDTMEGVLLLEPLRTFVKSSSTLSASDKDFMEKMLEPYAGESRLTISRVPDGNLFLLCGSTEGDELTLWRNYARENISFAVGLDPNVPLGIIPPDGDNVGFNSIQHWEKVRYQEPASHLPEEYQEQLRGALAAVDGGDRIRETSDQIQKILSFTKAKAFRDERETRLVVEANSTPLWRFRSGRFGITPYVALGVSEAWGKKSDGIAPLPIKKIRLSAAAKTADRLALDALLEKNGFAGSTDFGEVEFEGGDRGVWAFETPPPVKILQASNFLRA